MANYVPTSQKTSAFGVALVVCLGAGALVALFALLRFAALAQSSETDVLELTEMRFVAEVPVRGETLTAVLESRDDPAASFAVKIPNHWSGRTKDEGIPVISEQLATHYGDAYPRGNGGSLLGVPFAFYVDVPSKALSTLRHPMVFFHRMHGDWTIYADDVPIFEGRTEDRYLSVPVPAARPGRDFVRLSWKIQNRIPEYLIALDALHGLSIRSGRSAAWAQRAFPLYNALPYLVASITLLCFAIVTILLAGVSRRFDDLWAFAAFCFAAMLLIGVESPFTTDLNDTNDLVKVVAFERIRALIYAAFIVASGCLSLSFFRIRGRVLWTSVGFCALAGGYVGWRTWLSFGHASISEAQTLLAAHTTWALLATQIGIIAIGMTSMIRQLRSFSSAGLEAMAAPMKRRLAEASVFVASLWLMMIIYMNGLARLVHVSGDEIILLFGLAPAATLFTQFNLMKASGDRFRQRMLPRLDYADFLVEHLGARALERTYHGVLAVFDLAGFKGLTKLKAKSPIHAQAVDVLLTTCRAHLERIVVSGQTVFRYKSNGDENIWVMYAKDEDTARSIFVATTAAWQREAHEVVLLCQDVVLQTLGAEADAEDLKLLANLGLHVGFCLVPDLKIDPIGYAKHPDFSSDRFTFLSQAFKTSNHDRVAMYATDAALVMNQLSGNVYFEPDPDEPTIGYLSTAPRKGRSLAVSR